MISKENQDSEQRRIAEPAGTRYRRWRGETRPEPLASKQGNGLVKKATIGWATRDVTTDKPVSIPGQFHARIWGA